MCSQEIRPNKHKAIICDDRLVASKDGLTIEVMLCTLAWNWSDICEKCVVKIITKGIPDSTMMESRNGKTVRLNSAGFDLKERDFVDSTSIR